MRVKIELDNSCEETTVIIKAREMTDEISSLAHMISTEKSDMIPVWRQRSVCFIKPVDIVRAYSNDDRVYITSADGDYTVRMRLYELENRLRNYDFIRISSSEIINRSAVEHLDLRISGTISVTLHGGIITYVSRRFVKSFKASIGL